jgi:hypothetical protein
MGRVNNSNPNAYTKYRISDNGRGDITIQVERGYVGSTAPSGRDNWNVSIDQYGALYIESVGDPEGLQMSIEDKARIRVDRL